MVRTRDSDPAPELGDPYVPEADIRSNFQGLVAQTKQSNNVYVSQDYFDELYNHLKKGQEKRYQEVMAIVDDNLAKCQAFMRFGDEEFPLLKKAASKAVRFNQKAHRIFQADLVRKCRMDRIREAWRALKRNRQCAARKKAL